jgi:AcrR family transcriptional regulator
LPPKGQRSQAGERTRVSILDATIRILGRDGPERFSASALARETGASKATLFHHFRTIDEIPILAMERFWT